MNFGLQTALISCWLFPMFFTILVVWNRRNQIKRIKFLGIFDVWFRKGDGQR